MKKSLLLLVTLLASSLSFATSTPAGFTDDLDAALASAKDKGKFVYICFSGSDWCGWCIKLEKEVFSDATFAPAVKDKYELVFIDSPRDKSRLSETAKAKNPGLTKQYKVRGFPSYVVLKSDGTEVARGSAYRAGGAEKYAEYLNELAADPEKVMRMKKLEQEWVAPFDKRFRGVMDELNVACGKFMDAEAAKPENKAAGKTRDDFRTNSVVVVKAFVPKFREIVDAAIEKAKTAPSEIAPKIDEYAAGLDKWIKMIDEK